MNVRARKNIAYRTLGSVALLLCAGMPIYSIIDIYFGNNESKVLPYISCGAVLFFVIAEIILLMKGWKKDLALQKIAFTETDARNNVPFIAIIIGTVFGAGLMALSLTLFFLKQDEPYRTSSLVILSIAIYLVMNCLLYFAYLIAYKKRELDLMKLMK